MGKGGKSGKAARAAANNRANQMNPNNAAYAASRSYTKAMADNRSNQLNPNSEAYRASRQTGGPDALTSSSGVTEGPVFGRGGFGRGGMQPTVSDEARAKDATSSALPKGPPPDTKCWICGRTGLQVNEAMAGKTEDEIGVEEVIAEVRKESGEFEKMVSRWQADIPEKYNDFEFNFIRDNPAQFTGIKWLKEFNENAVKIVNELAKVWNDLLEGSSLSIGSVPARLKSEERGNARPRRDLDAATQQRLAVVDKFKDFQAKTGVAFATEDRYSSRRTENLATEQFKSKKLKGAVEYAAAAGHLYYLIQLDALTQQLNQARGGRVVWKVGYVHFENNPRKVPICGVCEELLSELHPVSDEGDWD